MKQASLVSTTAMAAGLLALVQTAVAQDLVNARILALDMARDIASAAIEACRKDGYQVSVAVTDRSGDPLVILRDIYSNRYLTKIALGKANAVVMSNVSSAELRRNRGDMVNELNLLDGILVLDGGLPVQVAGSLVGAVGVSGAPTGEVDEMCARKGIDAVQERLDFAD
ncbi:MAG: heme-binding protein [Gammaproteobacteria bacterium]|jgi:uncharacterized protein GlcG (DUF336 family)